MPAGYDYYALIPLRIGSVLAFNPGQLVPDSTVASQGWTVGYEVQLVGDAPPSVQSFQVLSDTDGVPYVRAV